MEKEIQDACFGCTAGEWAVVLAMAMIESDHMDHSDTSKGTSGGRSNWSPWNMNMDQARAPPSLCACEWHTSMILVA